MNIACVEYFVKLQHLTSFNFVPLGKEFIHSKHMPCTNGKFLVWRAKISSLDSSIQHSLCWMLSNCTNRCASLLFFCQQSAFIANTYLAHLPKLCLRSADNLTALNTMAMATSPSSWKTLRQLSLMDTFGLRFLSLTRLTLCCSFIRMFFFLCSVICLSLSPMYNVSMIGADTQ